MQRIHTNAIQRRANPLIMHGAVFVPIIVLLFSMANALHQELHSAYAGTCIDYEPTENTINIMCNASFGDVVETIRDPDILENLGNDEYLLQANLQVIDGVTFEMGSDDDVHYLKIAGTNGIIVNGKIEIRDVTITSWDTEGNSPVFQTSIGSVPRAFIDLRVSEGGFIKDSEIAYLGYDEPPRRGIDLGESTEGPSHDFAISDSKIHDNWMGFYSAGAYNIIIDGNEFYNNIKYAMDPHTGTHNMTVSNNKVYNNQGFGVICSYQCYNIVYEENEVHDNAEAGLMFSKATHDSIMRNNLVYNQFGTATAISISESQNNEIYGNNISNSTYGISVHNPVVLEEDGMSSGNMIYDNTFDGVQNAIRALASSDNTFSHNTFGNVTDYHYIMTSDASIDIQNQIFSSVNIRGVSGANTLSIQDSGRITIDNSREHDTDEQPYNQVLSSQTINIDSARE
jgi:mannuronan 5-epimerase